MGSKLSGMNLIPEAALESALATLEWTLVDGELRKVVRRKDFADALVYVNEVGALADAVNHHPDIDIRWDTVTLHLVTHSRGGITEADLALASSIDTLT
jgi:4a-hydroxytetrahydrobiopterin dehydratase